MSERHARSRHKPSLNKRGITLIELLIVVTILSILVGVVLVRYEPGVAEQLQAAGQVVVADVAYSRSLAIANNSRYRLVFDIPGKRYWLEHSGSNAVLHTLPDSPYRTRSEAKTKQTTNLAKLPLSSNSIALEAVRKVGATTEQDSTTIEFGPLGALTQAEQAKIWLSAGAGTSRLYTFIQINPVTGIAELGDIQKTPPPAISSS